MFLKYRSRIVTIGLFWSSSLLAAEQLPNRSLLSSSEGTKPVLRPSASENNIHAYRHDGFYARFGIGPGYFWDSVTTESKYGNDGNLRGRLLSLNLMLGLSVVDGLILGCGLWYNSVSRIRAETNHQVYSRQEKDFNITFAQIGPFIDFYPNPRKGLHFQAAISLASYAGNVNEFLDDPSEDDYSFDVYDVLVGDPKGYSYTGGVGYDFWVGEQLSFGVLANLSYFVLRDYNSDGSTYHRIWTPALTANVTLN
jgi:hypothetical protein